MFFVLHFNSAHFVSSLTDNKNKNIANLYLVRTRPVQDYPCLCDALLHSQATALYFSSAARQTFKQQWTIRIVHCSQDFLNLVVEVGLSLNSFSFFANSALNGCLADMTKKILNAVTQSASSLPRPTCLHCI